MADRSLERLNRLMTALAAGMGSLGGGLWLVPHAAVGAYRSLPDRPPAALALGVMALLASAGLPAGWAAGKLEGWRILAPLAGTYLAPMIAWFAGLEPSWPACLAWAWALSFAGSWAGLGLAALLGRRKAE